MNNSDLHAFLLFSSEVGTAEHSLIMIKLRGNVIQLGLKYLSCEMQDCKLG